MLQHEVRKLGGGHVDGVRSPLGFRGVGVPRGPALPLEVRGDCLGIRRPKALEPALGPARYQLEEARLVLERDLGAPEPLIGVGRRGRRRYRDCLVAPEGHHNRHPRVHVGLHKHAVRGLDSRRCHTSYRGVPVDRPHLEQKAQNVRDATDEAQQGVGIFRQRCLHALRARRRY